MVSRWLDSTEGVIQYGRGQGRCGVTEDSWRWCPTGIPSKLLWLSPPQGAGPSQGWTWLSSPSPQTLQSWGCCDLVLSVLSTSRGNRRRPRGKGESSLRMAQAGGGACTAVHGLGWAAQTSCVHGHGWLSSALLGLAGVAVHEPGGVEGWHGTFSWLA